MKPRTLGLPRFLRNKKVMYGVGAMKMAALRKASIAIRVFTKRTISYMTFNCSNNRLSMVCVCDRGRSAGQFFVVQVTTLGVCSILWYFLVSRFARLQFLLSASLRPFLVFPSLFLVFSQVASLVIVMPLTGFFKSIASKTIIL
jgi:hypothetical protein